MKVTGKRFDLAVFPLSNAVLFPGVTLPLHIFEERYEKMLRDVTARGWSLAVPLAVPCNDHEFLLNTIAGAGQVQVYKEYPDGASDILVHGKQRVKLCSFIQKDPYFVMEAEVLEPLGEGPGQLAKIDGDFVSLVKSWAFINPSMPEYLPLLFDDFGNLGELVDFFAFHFLKTATEKQTYLNCMDPVERAEMLSKFLEVDLIRQSHRVTRMHKRRLLH
jgi:ATP-dependent Lon protease